MSPCGPAPRGETRLLLWWDLGFRVLAGSIEVDGPGRRCCRTRPGSFCLVACCRFFFLVQGRNELRGELPGLVVVPPGLQPGEGAVGELRKQAAHPLRLSPAQRQLIL